jgi:uroporphyrinogen-III synthase
VWIPRKEGCSQKWKAYIPDDQVITWVQYTLEVPTFSAALPAHKIAIISSPANANGYFQAGGSASCVAIGAATARALEQLGAEFEPAISADAGAIAEAVDRLVD